MNANLLPNEAAFDSFYKAAAAVVSHKELDTWFSSVITASPKMALAIGIALTIGGSCFMATGSVIMKVGIHKESNRLQKDVTLPLRSYLWWGGMASYTFGAIVHLLGLAFAPASILAPLNSLGLVVNAIGAVIFLDETLSVLDSLWTLVTVVGVTCCAVSSFLPHDKSLTVDGTNSWTDGYYLVYIVFCSIAVAISLLLIKHAEIKATDREQEIYWKDHLVGGHVEMALVEKELERELEKELERQQQQQQGLAKGRNLGHHHHDLEARKGLIESEERAMLFEKAKERRRQLDDWMQFNQSYPIYVGLLYSILSGIVGAQCVLQLKEVAVYLKLSVDFPHVWKWISPYLGAILGIASIVLQMHFLNLGLARGDATLVIPAYYVSWTVFGTLGGFAKFHESFGFSVAQIITFSIGLTVTLLSIVLMSTGEIHRMKSNVEEQMQSLPGVAEEAAIRPLKISIPLGMGFAILPVGRLAGRLQQKPTKNRQIRRSRSFSDLFPENLEAGMEREAEKHTFNWTVAGCAPPKLYRTIESETQERRIFNPFEGAEYQKFLEDEANNPMYNDYEIEDYKLLLTRHHKNVEERYFTEDPSHTSLPTDQLLRPIIIEKNYNNNYDSSYMEFHDENVIRHSHFHHHSSYRDNNPYECVWFPSLTSDGKAPKQTKGGDKIMEIEDSGSSQILSNRMQSEDLFNDPGLVKEAGGLAPSSNCHSRLSLYMESTMKKRKAKKNTQESPTKKQKSLTITDCDKPGSIKPVFNLFKPLIKASEITETQKSEKPESTFELPNITDHYLEDNSESDSQVSIEEKVKDHSSMPKDSQLPQSTEDQETQSTASSCQKTFKELGVCEELCIACESFLGWKYPTEIQIQALPHALEGRDIIGLAETGSGKTGAFTIPVLQKLLDIPNHRGVFALALAPTRELTVQIAEQFQALGAGISLRVCTIVGGLDMVAQAMELAKKPHVVVATPGRVVDHLENTKGFHLSSLKFLIMDEADRLLSMDFEDALNNILTVIPKDRNTYLFSATMTSRVSKLQRASLNKPVKVEINSKYDTVKNLVSSMKFIEHKYKWVYLVGLLTHLQSYTSIIFTNTCLDAKRLAICLRHLGFSSVCLHGKMTQPQRLGALNSFKSGQKKILIATEVGSRGLDIPHIDIVINFDVPMCSKDYIHRVGRTARAGKSGRSITLVTQYDIESYQQIETTLGKRLDVYEELKDDEWKPLIENVSEARRLTEVEVKENPLTKKGKHRRTVKKK